MPLTVERQGFVGRVTGAYKIPYVPAATLSNSSRLETLLRAGNLYLSLQDTIALTLENNMDIAIMRYGPGLADAAILQAQAGAFAKGVNTSVTAGPSGVSVSSAGTTAGVNLTPVSVSSTATASAVGGSVLQNTGPAIPGLDPYISANSMWSHLNTFENGSGGTGSYDYITNQNANGVTLSKGFLTGTSVSLGLSDSTIKGNSNFAVVNPNVTSALGITVTQNLLQGFGSAINSRQIRIAKNNREVSDLTFKLQVETTVAAVMELYWGLVALNDQVSVAREAIATAQRLYDDNQRQVAVGTLAPIEVTRAEAQIAASQQQLVVAQTQVLQQEVILKTALSRNGVSSPSIADARIIPTDRITIPEVEALQPVPEMMGMALSSRPELAQSRIQIRNQELGIQGTKNSLLPTLAAVVNLSNGGYAGSVGPYANGNNSSSYFTGGYGTC